MKWLFFTLLIIFPISIIGQTDTSDMVYPFRLNNRQQLLSYLEPDKPIKPPMVVSMPKYAPSKNQSEAIHINLAPIKIYEQPRVDFRVKDLHLPSVNDYRYGAMSGVGENAFLVTNSYQRIYPSLGQVRLASAQLGYQPVGWFNISGGAFASKYELYNTFNTSYGVGGKAQFILSDRVRINGYGQYARYNQDGLVAPGLSDMYPSTYFGSTLEVKLTDNLGVEGGLMREFSPFTGKWTNKPYIAPVFYEKKKKPRKTSNVGSW